jgi:asparagine synthase (glutamine-hydrolysing)
LAPVITSVPVDATLIDAAGAIFGVVGEADPAELQSMSARLGHRGSVSRVWSPGPLVHFGEQRRTRPVGGEEIAFTGCIDNASHVARMLGLPTDPTASHAALLLQVVRRLGWAGLAELSGQFAAALSDPSSSRVWLCRDMWGTRPLFWTRLGSRWLFASEYKALLAIPELPARPDRAALQYLHCTKYVPPNASCLEGVHSIPAGTYMSLGPGGGGPQRFAMLGEPEPRPSDGLAAQLRSAILDAARRQTAGHESVGVSLSAGIDSALTLAAARNVAPDRVRYTFTAGFGPDDPEIVHARTVARHFGTEHHEVFLPADRLPRVMAHTVWCMEDPIGREEKLFYDVVAAEAVGHVSLLLAGHNADALFAGMPRHLLASFAARLGPLRGPLEQLYHHTQTGTSARSPLGRLLVTAVARGHNVPPPIVIGGGPLPVGAPLPLGAAEPLTVLLRRAALDDANAHAAIERIHGAAGLSYNSPFFDAEVARCAFAAPDRFKIHGITQKYLLRQAAVGLLPPEVTRRPKSLPRLRHDHYFSDVLEALAGDLLSPAQVGQRGLFVESYVRKVRTRRGGKPYAGQQLYRFWSLLLTELWCRAFIDRRGVPPV